MGFEYASVTAIVFHRPLSRFYHINQSLQYTSCNKSKSFDKFSQSFITESNKPNLK